MALSTTSAQAQGKILEASADPLDSLSYVPREISSSDLNSIRLRICLVASAVTNDGEYDFGEAFDSILLEYSDIDPNDADRQFKLAIFWNRYLPGMICPSAANLFESKHIYKRIVDLNLHRPVLVLFFLRYPNEFPVDVNSVKIDRNGNYVTLLDYLYEILETPKFRRIYNAGQLIRLRRIIETRFDGKRVQDMSAEELESETRRYLQLAPREK